MRIDFYILSSDKAEARQQFACRLAEKALQQNNQVYIHTENAQQAEQLDDLLWSFSDSSFVPHAILGNPLIDEDVAVLIGCPDNINELKQLNPAASQKPNLLIKLADNLQPNSFSDYNFSRVAEIVTQDKQQLQTSRKNYRDYQQNGYDVHHHRL